MKNFLHLTLALLATTLVGCATIPPEVEGLHPVPEPQRTVTLPAPVTAKFIGVFNKEAEVGLLPGTFRLERENGLGQYFLGTAPAVWWKVKDEYVVARGGVWVPKAAGTSPRIWFYFQPQLRGKSLEEALAQSSPPAGDDTMAATAAVPPSATPMQAGLGTGIAFAIIAVADAEAAKNPTPQLYPVPLNPEFAPAVRSVFGTR